MATAYLKPQRVEFFTDQDGQISVVKDEDSVKSYTLDWADVLDSGETISTLTTSSQGVTVDSDSNTTTTTTVTVSKTGGYVKHTVATSASRTLIKHLQIYSIDA